MGLGSINDVSLHEAWEKAAEYRSLRAEGIDPLAARDKREAQKRVDEAKATTFAQCVDWFIADKGSALSNATYRRDFPNYALPVIGHLPSAAIDTPLVLNVLRPIWSEITVTATRVRSSIESVLDWAKVNKYRDGENPARWRGHLENVLPKPNKIRKVKHLDALPLEEMPAFMSALRKESDIPALALQFLILTAARTDEVIGSRNKKPASWSEIDYKNKVWAVPPDRMKGKRAHRVPLSEAALEALE
jgi:integrase